MIPFFFLRTTNLVPVAECAAYFPDRANTAFGSSADVTGEWASAVQANSFSFQVSFNGGSPTQWAQDDFTATTATTKSHTYSSASAGWGGAGTYRIFVIARRVSTGLYDITSESIYLTVP